MLLHGWSNTHSDCDGQWQDDNDKRKQEFDSKVKFVYEGHQVKVKLTSAKNVQSTYFHNVKLGRP